MPVAGVVAMGVRTPALDVLEGDRRTSEMRGWLDQGCLGWRYWVWPGPWGESEPVKALRGVGQGVG